MGFSKEIPSVFLRSTRISYCATSCTGCTSRIPAAAVFLLCVCAAAWRWEASQNVKSSPTGFNPITHDSAIVAPPPLPSASQLNTTVLDFWPSSPRPAWEGVAWGSMGPPLSIIALERSFTPPSSLEAWCPWAQVAATLEAQGNVSIVVIGGSVTTGNYCADADDLSQMKECSWPRHVERWLQRVRPLSRVQVHNLAVSGYGSLHWISAPIPLAGPVDAIIIDTANNGFVYPRELVPTNMDKLLRRLQLRLNHGRAPPAIMYLEVYPAFQAVRTRPYAKLECPVSLADISYVRNYLQ